MKTTNTKHTRPSKTTTIIAILAFALLPALFITKTARAEDAATDPAAAITLDEGEIFIEVAKQDQADQFKVQTPSGVMSVRGTKFGVKVDQGKATVNVVEGVVAALNDMGEVLLESGMASEILQGVLPESFAFDVAQYTEVLNLWKGGITKGKVRDFIKGKVKEKVQGEVKKKLGF